MVLEFIMKYRYTKLFKAIFFLYFFISKLLGKVARKTVKSPTSEIHTYSSLI